MSESSTSLSNGPGAITNSNSSGSSGNNILQDSSVIIGLVGLTNDMSSIRMKVENLEKENSQLKNRLQKCEDAQHKFLRTAAQLHGFIFGLSVLFPAVLVVCGIFFVDWFCPTERGGQLLNGVGILYGFIGIANFLLPLKMLRTLGKRLDKLERHND